MDRDHGELSVRVFRITHQSTTDVCERGKWRTKSVNERSNEPILVGERAFEAVASPFSPLPFTGSPFFEKGATYSSGFAFTPYGEWDRTRVVILLLNLSCVDWSSVALETMTVSFAYALAEFDRPSFEQDREKMAHADCLKT